MKTALSLAALASAASAFAPAPAARASSSLSAFNAEIGALPPLGFFDPLGLLDGADQAEFDRLREVEIKHGRISMVATVGYLSTAAGYRFDNFPADVPAGLGAFKALCETADGRNILGQMVVFFATAEFINRPVPWAKAPPEFPGDYRNGSLDFGWDRFDEETKIKKRTIELNNGRAAMCGILALMVHEQLGVSILPANPEML